MSYDRGWCQLSVGVWRLLKLYLGAEILAMMCNMLGQTYDVLGQT
jgi:hypothetical protein